MYGRFQIRRAVRALDRILVDLGLAVRTNLGRDLRFWLRSRTVQLVQSLDDHEDHEGGEQKLYDDLNEIAVCDDGGRIFRFLERGVVIAIEGKHQI